MKMHGKYVLSVISFPSSYPKRISSPKREHPSLFSLLECRHSPFMPGVEVDTEKPGLARFCYGEE